MRVISGIYKRRRFDVPRTFKARPTTDFAKENLFNVLNNYIDFEEGVTALDLFAGTGSISIELVSRGCDRVISVEKEPAHYSFICKIMKEVQTDKCLPIRGDVLDTIYPKGFNPDSMKFIPHGNGAQFEMNVRNDTAKSGAPVYLFEVKAPYDTYLSGLDKQEIINLKDLDSKLGKYSGLMVGSIDTPNNGAGNWE